MSNQNSTASTIAVFDLDGTLYEGHITRGIALHHRTKKEKRLQLYTFFVVHFPIWWLTRGGVISEEKMREIWATNIPWMFRGWTHEEGEHAFRWIAENYLAPRFIPEIVGRLKDHQNNGDRIILLSGTPTPLMEEVGRELGVQEVIGTDITLRNGRYDGRSTLPVCQGKYKGALLLEYLDRFKGADLEQSYAYADSVTDLSVLGLVGHPVAVRPDDELRSLAVDSGWEIIDC